MTPSPVTLGGGEKGGPGLGVLPQQGLAHGVVPTAPLSTLLEGGNHDQEWGWSRAQPGRLGTTKHTPSSSPLAGLRNQAKMVFILPGALLVKATH